MPVNHRAYEVHNMLKKAYIFKFKVVIPVVNSTISLV